MRKTVKEILKVFGLLVLSIIGICDWSVSPFWLKILIMFLVMYTLRILITTISKFILKANIIKNIKQINQNITELEKRLHKVQMYEYTRGKEFAKQFSISQRILCQKNIQDIEKLKNEVYTSFAKRILNEKIEQIRDIQYQMVILR